MSHPVVFLLPGLMCDEAVWRHQAKVLAAVADVHIPVFRGFTSLDAMAAHVLAQAPQQFAVVGHSMGGRVAFEVMAQVLAQPEDKLNRKRISHFAVMDTGAHPVHDGEAVKRQLLLDAAARKGLQAVADAWILPMLHPSHHADAALVADINAMILRNTVDDYRGQVQALLGRGDQRLLLPRIKLKTWLLCGDADGWSPVSQHEDMQLLLPRSELRVIANAGHMSTMEQPAAVSAALLEWISEKADD